MLFIIRNKFNFLFILASVSYPYIQKYFEINTYITLVFYIIILFLLFLLQLLASKELFSSNEVHNNFFSKLNLSIKSQHLFPLGIIIGIVSLFIFYTIFPNPISSGGWISKIGVPAPHPIFAIPAFGIQLYEFLSIISGILFIVLFHKLKLDKLYLFSLGFGPSLGIGVSTIDPYFNNIYTSIYFTTLFLTTVSVILEYKLKRKFILSLLTLLFLLPFAFIIYFFTHPKVQSLGNNYDFYSNGVQEIYYEQAFMSPPNLRITLNSNPEINHIKILGQFRDHFTVEVNAKYFPLNISYTAIGKLSNAK